MIDYKKIERIAEKLENELGIEKTGADDAPATPAADAQSVVQQLDERTEEEKNEQQPQQPPLGAGKDDGDAPKMEVSEGSDNGKIARLRHLIGLARGIKASKKLSAAQKRASLAKLAAFADDYAEGDFGEEPMAPAPEEEDSAPLTNTTVKQKTDDDSISKLIKKLQENRGNVIKLFTSLKSRRISDIVGKQDIKVTYKAGDLTPVALINILNEVIDKLSEKQQ